MTFLKLLNSLEYKDNYQKEKCKEIIFNISNKCKNELDLLSNRNNNIDFEYKDFYRLFKLLQKNYPIEYMFNKKYFLGNYFYIKKNNFIPRIETEYEIKNLLDNKKYKFNKVLDLCCGCGIIPISLKLSWLNSEFFCVDNNKKTIKTFKINLNKFNLENKISILNSNFFKLKSNNLPWHEFDFVYFNPPYINKKKDKKNVFAKYESKKALYAKNNGLEFYIKFFNNYYNLLNKNVKILVEIGFNQANLLSKILLEKNISNFIIKKDIFNNDRFILINF